MERNIVAGYGKSKARGDDMSEALKVINEAITLLAINELMLKNNKITQDEYEALKVKIEKMYL